MPTMRSSRCDLGKSSSLTSKSGQPPSSCRLATASASLCAERITSMRERAADVSRTSKMSLKAAGPSCTTTHATGHPRSSEVKRRCTSVPSECRTFSSRSFPHEPDAANEGRGSGVEGKIPRPLDTHLSTLFDSFWLIFGAVPAVGRDVKHDAVGVAELVLGIDRGMAAGSRMVRAAVRLDRLLHRLDIFHPDAEVM